MDFCDAIKRLIERDTEDGYSAAAAKVDILDAFVRALWEPDEAL